MGIFINLYLAPERIEPAAWNAVYQESLQLVNAFPFLICIQDADGYLYARRTEHIKDLSKGYAGWRSEGDLRDGANTESYQLLDDIQYYREYRERYFTNGEDSYGGEILLDKLVDEQWKPKYPQKTVNIWDWTSRPSAA
jgi:hypothetical protein